MTEQATDAPPQRPGSSFKLLWAGQAVSWTGSEISTVALPLVAVVTLGASASDMGWLTAAQVAPALFAGMAIGPIVDTRGARTTLLITEYGRFLLTACIPLLFFLGQLSFPILLLLAFLIGALTEIYAVSSMALIAEIVPVTGLLAANSRLNGTRSVAQIGGPAAGGLLVTLIGAPRTIIGDSLTYLVSAFSIQSIKLTRQQPEQSQDQRTFLEKLRAGTKIVFTDPRLRTLALVSAGFNVLVTIASALEIFYAVRELGLTPAMLGLAMGIGLSGGLIGAVLAARLSRRTGAPMAMTIGLLAAAPAPLMFVIGGLAGKWALWLVAAGLMLNSIGAAIYVVNNQSLRQELVDRAHRGTAFAAYRLLGRAGVLAGALLGGLLAAETSVTTALLLSGGGQVLIALLLLARRHAFASQLSAKVTSGGRDIP